MRRGEREITDLAEVQALLHRARICRLAFAVRSEPYIVPLCYGFDVGANALFFHTAREGRKIEFIMENPHVCFEIEGRAELRQGGADGCAWGMAYESVIGYGVLSEVREPAEKICALQCLMRHQAGRDAEWTFGEDSLEATRVWRLDIQSMTGKRSSGD